MPEAAYYFAAVATAAIVTFALRALPYAALPRLAESAVAREIATHLPLGAVTILAIYCLTNVQAGDAAASAGQGVGLAVTVSLHLWKRNAALSIGSGTLTCLVISNAG